MQWFVGFTSTTPHPTSTPIPGPPSTPPPTPPLPLPLSPTKSPTPAPITTSSPTTTTTSTTKRDANQAQNLVMDICCDYCQSLGPHNFSECNAVLVWIWIWILQICDQYVQTWDLCSWNIGRSLSTRAFMLYNNKPPYMISESFN